MEGLKQQNSRINAVQALLALVNAVLLIGGVMLALRALWGPRAPVMLLPALAADVCWAGWMAGLLPACRPAVRRGLRIAPWLLVLPLGGKGIAAGFLQLLNGVIYSWNTLHRGGVHLFDVAIQDGDILAFTLFAAVGVGQLAASMQIRRRVYTGAALAAVLLLPQLLAGGMSVWSCALYLSGLLGIWMSIPGQGPSLQGLRILSLCVLALFVFAFTAPRREMQTMQHLRESIVQQISILRYGREMLPMGQLEQANILHAGEKTRLTVVTEQENDLWQHRTIPALRLKHRPPPASSGAGGAVCVAFYRCTCSRIMRSSARAATLSGRPRRLISTMLRSGISSARSTICTLLPG